MNRTERCGLQVVPSQSFILSTFRMHWWLLEALIRGWMGKKADPYWYRSFKPYLPGMNRMVGLLALAFGLGLLGDWMKRSVWIRFAQKYKSHSFVRRVGRRWFSSVSFRYDSHHRVLHRTATSLNGYSIASFRQLALPLIVIWYNLEPLRAWGIMVVYE